MFLITSNSEFPMFDLFAGKMLSGVFAGMMFRKMLFRKRWTMHVVQARIAFPYMEKVPAMTQIQSCLIVPTQQTASSRKTARLPAAVISPALLC